MMKDKHLVHKISMIGAFCCCAVAVVFLVNQRINFVSAEVSTLNSTGVMQLQPINGVCSEINGTRSVTMPTGNLCKSGTPSVVETKIVYNNTGWTWRCSGINGGANSYCNVIKYVETVADKAVIEPVTDTVAVETVTPNISNTSSATSTVTTQNPAVSDSDINSSSSTINEPITRSATNITAVEPSRISSQNDSDSVSTSNEQDTAVRTEDRTIIRETGALQSDRDIISGNVTPEERGIAASQPQIEKVEKSAVVKPPVVVQAKDLSLENNPKISGSVDASLRVETVELNKKEDGKNNVELSGKAQPDSLVTIYIFSNDPVVITVKADANGNWNYELDRDLDDGQHEAYVAVTDNSGKIVSKSEPIAFVKTAQAATMIPLSELTANQSPVERVSQQYVLMAIIIMSIFLALALVSIGFLTHKRNLDERVD